MREPLLMWTETSRSYRLRQINTDRKLEGKCSIFLLAFCKYSWIIILIMHNVRLQQLLCYFLYGDLHSLVCSPSESFHCPIMPNFFVIFVVIVIVVVLNVVNNNDIY